MTLRRLAVLQWLGLLLGAVVWATGHLVGYGLTEAACDSAGFRIDHDFWQVIATATAAGLVLAAEAAAVAVVRGTRGTTYDGDLPASRIRFLAIAGLVANAIFLVTIVLDALGAIFNVACRQA